MKYKIEDERNLIRIDKYLIDKLDASRSNAQDMIKQKLVLVNNKEVKKNYVLKMNDEVEVLGNLKKETNVLPEKMDLDIIYEDDDVIVINKPSGMVVHPANGHYSGTLVNGLLAHTNSLSGVNGSVRPGIVHRIDKDTSGLLVVAKNDKAHDSLANQLKDKTLSRIYIALVYGVINHDTGEIDAPISRDDNDRKKMAIKEDGKDAITYFKVLERYKNASLIECKLETGRTHQIRVHMKYINHPIVNDPVYSGRKLIDKDFGQMLHAKEISFIHPRTNKKMTFSCDVPERFKEIVDIFKNE